MNTPDTPPQNGAPPAGGGTEFSFSSQGPSGWNTPENVRQLIDRLPKHISEWIESTSTAQRAAIEASKVMHGRAVALGAVIVTAAIAVAISAALDGQYNTAERIVLPLLGFIGGLGIGLRIQNR